MLHVRLGGNRRVFIQLQHIGGDLALIRAGLRRGHVHGGHGHHGGAARRAGLGADVVLHLLYRGDGNALDLAVLGLHSQLRAVLHRGEGVRAVHGHGDARTHAQVAGFLAAGGVTVHIVFDFSAGIDDQLAIQLDIRRLVDQALGVHRGHLHGDRAAQARVGLAVAGLSLGLHPAGDGRVHLHVAGGRNRAFDVRAGLAVGYCHGQARAQAGLKGGAVGLAGLKLASEGHRRFLVDA